jgi:hypothetical protein
MVHDQGIYRLHRIWLAQANAPTRCWYLPDTSITPPIQCLLLKLKRRVFFAVITQRASPVLTQFSSSLSFSFFQQEFNEISDFSLRIRRQFFDKLIKRFRLRTHSSHQTDDFKTRTSLPPTFRICTVKHIGDHPTQADLLLSHLRTTVKFRHLFEACAQFVCQRFGAVAP